MSGDAGAYRSFFARNGATLERRARQAAAWFAGLGLLLLALLFWLGSGLWVGIYVVAGLYLGLTGALGFVRLRTAVHVTEEAVGHLEEIARAVEDEPTRDQLRRYVEEMGTPQDRSNVPEAILHFVEGDRVGADPENVARSALSHARDALEHAGLLRNVLILGGLFGTVLFFAHELNAPAVAGGDITELLPGLKGALASTLAGIASSVCLGFYGSDIDEQLDGLVRETEAFLGGPVARSARRRPAARPAEDETELWENLRAEVRQMTVETREAYEGLAEDVRAHTDVLHDLGERLAQAPPIQVPEELRNLEVSVETFAGSARLLGELVPPLLETVAAMEVFAPAKLTRDVEEMRQRLDALGGELDRTREAVREVSDVTRSAARSLEEVPERLDRGFSALMEETDALAGQIRRIREAAEAERSDRREVHREMADGMERTHREIRNLREELHVLPEEIRSAASQLDAAAEELAPLAGHLERAGTALEARGSGDGSGPPDRSSRVPELVEEVRALRRRVADISGWVDRARSAPLMRLLTWPGFSRHG